MWKNTRYLCLGLAVAAFTLTACQNPVQTTQVKLDPGQERAINSNSPTKPFPQGLSFAGTIKPNHRTQTQLNQDVLEFFNYWQGKYVMASNGNTPGGGYYIKADSTGGHDYPIKSNSEAHGYGMIIFALMADKEKFDGMYNMYNQHRSTGNNNLMSWVITQDEYPSQDGGSATDGDMDIAYALLLADKQWGSSGAVNYLAEARRIITSGLKASDFSTSTYRTLLGDWSSDQYATRSSDWMAGHMRAYGQATGDAFWSSAASTVYSLISSITNGYSSQTGLMPDFIINASPRPASPNFLEGSNDGAYYYNACRFPWRIATDYAHNGTSQAKTALDKINTWLKTSTGNNPANIKSGYSLSGSVLSGSDYFSGAFAAPFVTGMIVNSANQQYLNQGWDTIRNSRQSYYEDNVTLLCMLMISGNWWSPAGTTPTPGDTQAPSVPGNFRSTGITSNAVSLAWNASSDNLAVTGYRISYGNSSINTTGTSYTVTSLSSNTSYTFSIRAYDAAGNLSPEASVTAKTSGTSTYPAWNSSTIYYQGDVVSYSGKNWRAQWWTQGEVPGTTGQWGVWREI